MNPQKLSPRQFKDIIDRYLRNDATPEETSFVEGWYEELGSNAQLIPNMAQQDEVKERILQSLQNRRRANKDQFQRRSSYIKWVAAAAAIIVAAGVSFYFTNLNSEPTLVENKIETPMPETFHSGKAMKKITLPEGSTISLQPFSSVIIYPFGQTDKREVSLVGEAFFKVTPDAAKPFLVYTGKIATKVLGTSFNICTKGDAVEIAVKTGLVSVAEMADSSHTVRTAREEILLTPNQRATYNVTAGDIKKSLIANPRPVPSATITGVFMKFDEAPVSEIFDALEKAYEVDLIYDPEEIKNCRLTTDLQDESLYARLSIICKAIHGSYEINDMRVVIKSSGCPKL